MSPTKNDGDNLGQWIRGNPAVIIQFFLLAIGAGMLWGQMSQDAAENRRWRERHLAWHSETAKQNEGRFTALEAKVQPLDTYGYRLAVVEKSVQDGTTRFDRLQTSFNEASSKMADRLTRIETLLERMVEVQTNAAKSGR